MNQKSLKWGIGIILVWLIVMALFWLFGDLESPKSLNELGDALAGIFAPVAFLWLVLGYGQQSVAIQTQINEFKEFVKHQATHIHNAKYSVRPRLTIQNGECEIFEIKNQGVTVYNFKADLYNSGLGPALSVRLITHNYLSSFFTSDKILENSQHQITFSLTDENIAQEDGNLDRILKTRIFIYCTDQFKDSFEYYNDVLVVINKDSKCCNVHKAFFRKSNEQYQI